MQSIRPTHARHARDARSRSRHVALALAASALLSLTAAACGSGATEPGVKEGTGTVTATGAVSTSGSGLAVFQSVSSSGMSLFQIMVAPTSQTTTATWQLQIVNYSGRLAVGTYTLSPLSVSSGNPTANFYYTSGGTMEMFNATSGNLVITSSSSSAVRGTFTFTATNFDGTSSVTAQGSFNAQCAPGLACL